MGIPEFQAFMLPLLRLLADGQDHQVSELRDQLANEFGVTAEEREQRLPSGRSQVFSNRVAWARTDLGQAGALESVKLGSVRITERGRSILAEHPQRVDRKYLRQFPEFMAFSKRRREKVPDLPSGAREAEPDESPVTTVADGTTATVPLDDEAVDDSPPTEDAPNPPAGKGLSFTDAAERVLDQYAEKRPMHYRAITQKALDLGLVRTQGQTPEATMYAQILTEITRTTRQGSAVRFVKHGKGVVGLSTWTVGGLTGQIDQHNREMRRQLLARLAKMPPVRFEELVGQLLVALGFQDVLVTNRSGDGGIDVRGTLVVGDVIRTRMAVQVKRWKANVQAPTVQQVRGSLGTHDQGLIITTSNFSAGARAEAERANAVPVALMNGEQLVALLVEHDIGVRRDTYNLIELASEVED